MRQRMPEVLLLGTMPSVASLQKGQYYGFGRNAFWPLLYALWGRGGAAGRLCAAAEVCAFTPLALWDVLRTCERKGSADASIRAPRPTILPPSPRHTRISAGCFSIPPARRRCTVVWWFPIPLRTVPKSHCRLPHRPGRCGLRTSCGCGLCCGKRWKNSRKGKTALFRRKPCTGCG